MTVKPPFSRRILGSQWIQDDFPDSARIALLHLLHDLVDRMYVNDWIDIDREIRRIGRDEPQIYDSQKAESIRNARLSAEKLLKILAWPKIFDFCERLQSHLAKAVGHWNDFNREMDIETDRDDVRLFIGDELQRIFLEENLAFTFDHEQGEVQRRGRGHTAKQVAKAEPTFSDPRLNSSREHFRKATQYFNNRTRPDYENTVKEAVCAIEAAARSLFSDVKAKTLGEVIKQIQGSGNGQLPKPIADSITGLYAYRNAGDGVSHGGADGGKPLRLLLNMLWLWPHHK
ncbi:MAG: hypothetical protein HGB19_06955 [Chlorobiales bacterium]|nr:hypothetical protein [Chlorobiales bacterium]